MTSLYVHESGTRGAPLIIFLHGAGVSSWMWQEQIAHFQDYHCLAVDLPGHGKSNQRPWVSYPDTAAAVAEIIQKYDGKAHVVGLSLGSYIAQHLIADFPHTVDHAILTGTTISPLTNAGFMLLMTRGLSCVMKLDPVIRLTARVLNLPPDAHEGYMENMRAMSRKAYVRISEETVHHHMPEALKERHAPTLVVAGENELQPVRESTRLLSQLMPNAQGYIVPKVGHVWSAELPDVFNAMIRAWITDRPLPTALQPLEAVRV
jgi:pimeloyl-ACP methyl ester carboxylesterase